MKTTYPYNREMPVSAKFYSRLRQRVSTILIDLDGKADPGKESEVMRLVNIHLGMQPCPQEGGDVSFVSRIIFHTLRAEIDAAVERSRRCREAAARRRAAREASLSTEHSSPEVVTPEPEALPSETVAEKTAETPPPTHAVKHPHVIPPRKCSFQRLKFRPVVNVRQRNYAKFRKR